MDYPAIASVLIAGHNGSRTSSLAKFVEPVQPQISVFTVGYRNRFGHPHPQVVERFREQGTRILRSDNSGLIKLTFSQASVMTSEYRPTYRHYWLGSAQ